ncbi:MAG: hypothetical protein GX621_16115, partial [Pirellulaceae bacterium]|nr:hypothetical protein [Pirellulaceae bacterium]
MSHSSLADFLEELHRLGELRLVEDEVDGEGVWAGTDLPGLDSRRDVIPQLTHAAVLFRNVRGQSFPLAAGLLATQARICHALGVATLAEAANRVAAAFSTAPPRESLVRDGVGRRDACLARHAPRLVKTGESQKIVRLGGDVDLEQLPGPKRPSRLETHRTLTAGVLATRDPDSGEPVVGHAVASIRSRDELAVHFEPLD